MPVAPANDAVGASKAGDARGVAVLPAKATVAKFATPNLRVFFADFGSWFYALLSLLFYFAVCCFAPKFGSISIRENIIARVSLFAYFALTACTFPLLLFWLYSFTKKHISPRARKAAAFWAVLSMLLGDLHRLFDHTKVYGSGNNSLRRFTFDQRIYTPNFDINALLGTAAKTAVFSATATLLPQHAQSYLLVVGNAFQYGRLYSVPKSNLFLNKPRF